MLTGTAPIHSLECVRGGRTGLQSTALQHDAICDRVRQRRVEGTKHMEVEVATVSVDLSLEIVFC